MAKKVTAAEFFDKHNRSFMKFGELFTKKITDEELIAALAEKDLEKLARSISDTLSRSLGYYGSNTIIEDRIYGHIITKDGYTILNRIKFNN